MPSAHKVAWAQLRVGIMAVVALMILGVLVYLLTGDTKFFATESTVYTFLPDSFAMSVGAPVRLNGILAGKVTKVALSGSKERARVVRIDLSIDDAMIPSIPKDSEAVVAAESVLSSKYINIKKGVDPVAIKSGEELRAQDTAGFEEVVASGYKVMESARFLLKRIDAIVSLVEQGRGSIGKLLVDDELYRKAVQIAEESRKLVAALNTGKGTISKLIYEDTLYQDIRQPIARIDALIAELQQGQGTAGKLLKDPAVYNELQKNLVEMRTLLADLNAGKGSAGKLLKSDELHNKIVATMGRVDTTIDRVNSGQGTLGQLLVNPSMYENVNGFTAELNSFIKEFRQNPKKFLTVRVSLF